MLRERPSSTAPESPLRIFYVQVTLGPAHLARIRALDAIPGVRCLGVELAAREESRDYQIDERDRPYRITLEDGVYEQISRWKVLRAGARLLWRERPDVMIFDRPADPVQWMMALFGRRLGVRAFTRWASLETDFPRSPLRERLKALVYRDWDAYLVTGKRARRYLETFGVPGARIFECGNPADAGPIEAARVASGEQARTHVFLYAGRFLPFKNLSGLLREFAGYRAAGGTWELHLAGFGDEEKTLRQQARDIPGVRFLGHVQFAALTDLYLRSGCFVLPSFSEPWGLVVNEAMHAGMPVIVSEPSGCVPELVRPGINGFVFDPNLAGSLQAALRRMEELSAAERASFGRSAAEIAALQGPEGWAHRVLAAARAVGVRVPIGSITRETAVRGPGGKP